MSEREQARAKPVKRILVEWKAVGLLLSIATRARFYVDLTDGPVDGEQALRRDRIRARLIDDLDNLDRWERDQT